MHRALNRQLPAAYSEQGPPSLFKQHDKRNGITKKQAFKVTSVGLISCVISLPSVEIGFVTAA